MAEQNARAVALRALIRLERDQSYSNLVLDALLRDSVLSAADKGFASRLFYGTVERRLTLDYLLSQVSSRPVSSLSLEIRLILWTGLYQLRYMSVPESAAVNESVRLAAAVKPAAKGFVNAVLRRYVRDGKPLDLSALEGDRLRFYSVLYSCPEWLVRQFWDDYGEERMKEILADALDPPPVTLRVNPLRVSDEALAHRLAEEGVETCSAERLPHCLRVVRGNPTDTGAFREGLFHVQDVASQLCALTAASGAKTLFDLCAAPGGKSFTAAQELAHTGGSVRAFDLHPKRVGLIESGAKRLGLGDFIEANAGNALEYDPTLGQADCVLCDVPCSGLGVIRRKPEIKYKPPESFARLPQVQRAILQNAARYVAPGGRLIYSTCSLSKRENEEVTGSFLEETPAFRAGRLPDLPFLDRESFQTTFFPQRDGPDGFYLAVFEKAE